MHVTAAQSPTQRICPPAVMARRPSGQPAPKIPAAMTIDQDVQISGYVPNCISLAKHMDEAWVHTSSENAQHAAVRKGFMNDLHARWRDSGSTAQFV